MVKLGGYDAELVEQCPICGEAGVWALNAPLARHLDPVDVYACPKCDATYYSPRMTRDAMISYYRDGGYIGEMKGVRKNRGNFGERRRALRLMMIFMNIHNIKRPTRALDVGCSEGHFLERMKDWWYGIETVGYDVYKNPNALCDVITDKSKITGEFDLITCIHALEHTYNPIEELEWMNSLLVEDGTLVLELPVKRYIMLEHPITFALNTVPVAMEKIGIENFTTMNFPSLESCIVFARK